MASCVPDTRYLASPEFLRTTLHYFSIAEGPVLTFGAYCILYKTPVQMKSVKWLMLHLHFWSSLSDLLLSVIGIPFILLPAPAGLGLGLIEAPRLLIYSAVTAIAGLTASVMAIYENRYYVLFGKNTLWRNFRKPYLILIFSLVPLCFLPPFFNVPEQESARLLVKEMLPCLPEYDFEGRQLFVLALSYTIPMYCIATGMVVLAVSISVFSLLMVYNMWYRRSNLSARALTMQRAFAVSLTIQSIFMLSFILAPVIMIIWILVSWHYDQAFTNFVFITLSLHGVGSTVMMIFIHKSYREFIFSKVYWISGRKGKATTMKSVGRSVAPSVAY